MQNPLHVQQGENVTLRVSSGDPRITQLWFGRWWRLSVTRLALHHLQAGLRLGGQTVDKWGLTIHRILLVRVMRTCSMNTWQRWSEV